MSSSFTLATLKTQLQEFAEDSGTDLSGNLDEIIKLAEDKCLIDLDLDIFDVTNDNIGNMTVGDATLDMPAGSIKFCDAYYVAAGKRVGLDMRSIGYVKDYGAAGTNGAPLYFAQLDNNELIVAPAPDNTYQWGGIYVKRPNSLVVDTTGSWLSTNVGSLLFKAALLVTQEFGVVDERVPLWKTEYQEDLARRLNELAHLRRRNYETK